MYIAAQRIRDASGNEAIHGFRHQHGDVDWPADVASWPETRPGRLVAQATRLPLGSNAVLSYLDVLAPDGTSQARVGGAVSVLRGDLEERVNPTVLCVADVTLRFGVEGGLWERRATELDALLHVVDALMARRTS